MITITIFSSISFFLTIEYSLHIILEELDDIIFIERVTTQDLSNYKEINLSKLYFERITNFDSPDYEDNIF